MNALGFHPSVQLLVVLAMAVGCRGSNTATSEQQEPERGLRTLPSASGVVTVAAGGVPSLVVKVHPDVLAAYDVRWRPDDPGIPYNQQNEPWFWTDVEQTAAAAGALRDVLTRMVCGADADLTHGVGYSYDGLVGCTGFELQAWDDTDPSADDGAILVGRPSDFDFQSPFGALTRFNREAFRNVATDSTDSLYLLGNEGAGVQQAVVSLLRTLGYRYYLPTDTWEVVPDFGASDMETPGSYDVSGGPARGGAPGFLSRRLAFNAVGNDARYDFQTWVSMNGFQGAFQATGVQNQWGRIFAEDPATYTPVISTSSVGTTLEKFCPNTMIGGVTLGQYIRDDWADDKLAQTDPTAFSTLDTLRDTVAFSPGDGAYWAGCDDGLSPADRLVRLANGVGDQLGMGDKYINVLAYRETYPGPLFEDIGTNLFVWMVGNGWKGIDDHAAFVNWKFTRQCTAEGREPTEFGHYVYWNAEKRELPDNDAWSQAPVSAASQLLEKLDLGFAGLWIETGGGWGAQGLFKYILLDIARDPSSAQATDPRQAVDDLFADVGAHAFPAAATPHIVDYLSLLDVSDQRFLLSPDVIADLYASLNQARTASAGDPAALSRVEDLMTYVRHVDLLWRWKAGGGQTADYAAYIEHAVCADERRMLDYSRLWAIRSGDDGVGRTAYLADHKGQAPSDVYSAKGFTCDIPKNGWSGPADELVDAAGVSIDWFDGGEGPYGRATVHPGNPGGAAYEANLRGLPRDSLLWKVWVDPADGLLVEDVCYGIDDDLPNNPEGFHTTTRMLGTSRVTLTDPATGEEVCFIDLNPTREGKDVDWTSLGAVVSDDDVVASACRVDPNVLPLDTGIVDTGLQAGCDPALFVEEGIYDLRTHNHRSGLDYDQLVGADLGVSRWESPVGPFEERRPVMSNWNRFFYVPESVDEVALWNDGRQCKLKRDGCPDIELGTGAPGYRVIDANPACGDQRGSIWAISFCNDTYVVNVPPVVAPRRDQLLVSCDFLADPAQAADAKNLAPVGCP
ncbi:MAG: hypothetical protein KTR31_19925 [Myxococcales bacterium]|nr:hypothetical protein [Myxococcales bacterium]